MGHIKYILSTDLENYDNVQGEITDQGATIEWRAPGVCCLGLKIPSDRYRDIEESVSAISGVNKLMAERRGGEQSVHVEDTSEVSVIPDWNPEEEMRRTLEGVEDELDISVDELLEEHSDTRSGSIAIIDSGIDTRNPDIDNVRRRVNYTSSEQLDETGHGTLIALENNYLDNFEYIYDLKVASNTELNESSVIRALEAAIGLEADFINLSLGFPDFGDREPCILCDLCNDIYAETETLILAAAGNHGIEGRPAPSPKCPARAAGVEAIGARNEEGERASYSASADVYSPDRWIPGEGSSDTPDTE